jgi:putative phage-type endonuclease
MSHNNELQGTNEWLEKRKGKVTASAIGAIMGVNPYQSRADVMRTMVRDHFGAEREFTGNAATQYGHDHEETAISDYEVDTGNTVTECGFIVHHEFDWLGASPDGFIGTDGLIEIKCPYHAKKPYTLAEKEYYKLQVYLQLVVTERDYCDFYVWLPKEQHLETVYYEDAKKWFDGGIDDIKAFYDEYQAIIADEKKAAPYLEDLEIDLSQDEEWIANVEEYHACKARFEEAKLALDQAKSALIGMAERHNKKCTGVGVMAYKATRQGNVNYKSIPELKTVNLDDYRGKGSSYWVVK